MTSKSVTGKQQKSMPEVQQPASLTRTMTSGNPARQHTTLESRVYVVRVIFSITTLAMLALNDALCRGVPGDHLWILIVGLLYPHVGQLLLGRFDISRRRGHLLFMLDGLFVGTVIGALDFALFPSAVLLLTNLFNWLVIGGASLLAFGITFLFAGALIAGTTLPLSPTALGGTCNATQWVAGIILVGHFIIVARIIHRLVSELRLQQVSLQAQTDSAITAKTTAEQALLAILPASVAQRLMDTGTIENETLQHATLLFLEFGHEDGLAASHDELKEAFPVGERILARHGIELIKTWGHQAIALGRGIQNPEKAVTALREIDAFFADHAGLKQPDKGRLTCRGVIHQGAVTLGLVQPTRLNLDITGEPVRQLHALSKLLSAHPAARIIVSSVAYEKLANPTGFTLVDTSEIPSAAYLFLSRQEP